jgi:UDP-N-acetylmuramate dehydrogenase
MNVLENYPLKKLNTFGINVKSKYLVEVNSTEEILEIIQSGKFKNLKKLVLGGGSNVLFTKDYNGLIILNKIKGKKVTYQDADSVKLLVGAGENWHELVMYTVEKGWGGIENLSLIPGNTGTAPMQNIGAYGVEIKDTFVELEALEISTGKIEKFNKEKCKFAYRESIFKNEKKNQYIILNITLELNKNPKLSVNYGEIKNDLKNKNIHFPTIKDVSEAITSIRKRKLPDPKKIGNSGSFFKNPVVNFNKLKKLKEKYPNIVNYPINKNEFKIAAGWMIEKAGWKGKTINNYGVHKNQSLVLVNYGDAKGIEIYNLSKKIIVDIEEKFGISLVREVNII